MQNYISVHFPHCLEDIYMFATYVTVIDIISPTASTAAKTNKALLLVYTMQECLKCGSDSDHMISQWPLPDASGDGKYIHAKILCSPKLFHQKPNCTKKNYYT